MRKKNFIILMLMFGFISLFSGEKTRQEIVSELFNSIEGWFGVPYVLGGQDKSGIDCSGFTGVVYQKVFNMTLPRTVASQKNLGQTVVDKLQPGDLVFFDTLGSGVSHVGIYVFDNKFIHAASAGPNIGVIKSSLDEKYYKNRYLFAKRVVKLPPFANENGKDNLNVSSGSKTTNNIENVPNKVNIVFYKFLTNGRIIDKSLVFDSNNPIFYKIQNPSDENDIILQFENEDTRDVKEIYLNLIDRLYMQSVRLKTGNYKVKFIKDNDILFEKKIIVTPKHL